MGHIDPLEEHRMGQGGNSLQNIIAVSITALLLLFLAPVLLFDVEEESDIESACLIVEQWDKKENIDNINTILLKTKDGLQELLLEEYLISVVLSEMPPSFETEALKAQSVAARTFALKQLAGGKHESADICSSSACCQAWKSEAELKQCYGNQYGQYWEKIKQAVESTAGEVLTYNGELIDAVYFSSSGGLTENAAEVWGSDVPYLQSVPSDGEQISDLYLNRKEIPIDDFCKTLQTENNKICFEGKPSSWFGEISLTKGGGVKEIVIGGVPFTGTRLRSLFDLNSTKFTVEIGNHICFVVSGYGHRVGMSQYGANVLAKQGKSYEEILLHYYTGVKLDIKNP